MKVVRGIIQDPYKWLFYSGGGLGKSTFGSFTDRPIFAAIEDGTNQLDVARASNDDGSKLEKYEDVLGVIESLKKDALGFGTLVIDTADALNAWIEDFVCRQNGWLTSDGKPNIEKPGYGNGYRAAGTEWRMFLSLLERLQTAQKLNILLLAHAHVKKYSPPDSEPYDRYDIKVSDTAASLLHAWNDCVYFGQHEVAVTKVQGESKKRGFATGDRIIHTVESAGIRAKNRYGLPSIMKLTRTDETFREIEKCRLVDHNAEFEKLLDATPAAKEKAAELRAWFAKKTNKGLAIEEARAKFAASAKKEAA